MDQFAKYLLAIYLVGQTDHDRLHIGMDDVVMLKPKASLRQVEIRFKTRGETEVAECAHAIWSIDVCKQNTGVRVRESVI